MSYSVLVFGMSTNPGGIESFLLNYVRNLNKDKIKITFLNLSKDPIAYYPEIRNMNCEIINLQLVDRRRHPLRYKKDVNRFFKNNAKDFDCIWFNLVNLRSLLFIKMAFKNGISKIIIHAHNSAIMVPGLEGKILSLRHNFNRIFVGKYSTDLWACSSKAGKWFYGNRKFKIIKNAINISKFKFDLDQRNEIRKKLSIDKDTYVIGNVGRLQYQKNQGFAIKLFKKYLKINPKSFLIFVGQGEDYDNLKKLIKKYNIQDKVFLVGKQSNIQAWLSSFDLFILPSRFEGLPIAGLEAQANGIPILASSDGIPSELKINPNFYFLSLKDSTSKWCYEISEMKNKFGRLNQKKIEKNFKRSKYDIDSSKENWNQFG